MASSYSSKTRVLIICIAIYVGILHAILALLIVRPYYADLFAGKLGLAVYDQNRFYQNMVTFHQRVSGNIPKGAVLFIGDSIIQGLAVNAVAGNAVNLGIGGDTSAGVIRRIEDYRYLESASVIVIAIGVNDLAGASSNQAIVANIETILQRLPSKVKVVLSAILPVDEQASSGLLGYNQRIGEINNALNMLAKKHGAVFIDAGADMKDANGNLKRILHIGDGLHLNPTGYQPFIHALQIAIK
ncbi:GDSL-type esterase/lipase family protein [Teredinibacter sp. KSP-S5-2]|uniref:GDSL-type esterase/lipase family protein n=1 Tax=Teredinibacter sp. KSP-S5-2 TaxID=3034506 RepID=UPI002934E48C|nr:GDSL-type esterase/lipase family protein [Teredinibacter sp. KSP-S5-2]WNO09072.1 GDSL-type esterase/lipase family protein [Teredinibacter sp. KSP-S5-2]